MESKVAEAMSKKETLKARALSAETTKQLNESIVSMVWVSQANFALLHAHPHCLPSAWNVFDYMLLHFRSVGHCILHLCRCTDIFQICVLVN